MTAACVSALAPQLPYEPSACFLLSKKLIADVILDWYLSLFAIVNASIPHPVTSSLV